MVFDAHDRAFALFKAACGRGIYDNNIHRESRHWLEQTLGWGNGLQF